nr:hypothetical protein [Stieleria neptunia]
MFDLVPHRNWILQGLVTRDPHDLVPSLGQILGAALIILTALIRLMLLTIDLNDQLQVHTTEINGVRCNRVFAPKLLISTTAIAQHLPDISGELICAGTLIAGE